MKNLDLDTDPNIQLKKRTPTLSLRVLCGCSVHRTRNERVGVLFSVGCGIRIGFLTKNKGSQRIPETRRTPVICLNIFLKNPFKTRYNSCLSKFRYDCPICSFTGPSKLDIKLHYLNKHNGLRYYNWLPVEQSSPQG